MRWAIRLLLLLPQVQSVQAAKRARSCLCFLQNKSSNIHLFARSSLDPRLVCHLPLLPIFLEDASRDLYSCEKHVEPLNLWIKSSPLKNFSSTCADSSSHQVAYLFSLGSNQTWPTGATLQTSSLRRASEFPNERGMSPAIRASALPSLFGAVVTVRSHQNRSSTFLQYEACLKPRVLPAAVGVSPLAR